VAYDYDISNDEITNRTIIINIPTKIGRPDGMTIDEEGMLWIALWGGGKITRWNPFTGKLIRSISLPVAQVTSCTFGGKDLDDIYITSAKVRIK
jgi:sugar lactone lactonase YvrE